LGIPGLLFVFVTPPVSDMLTVSEDTYWHWPEKWVENFPVTVDMSVKKRKCSFICEMLRLLEHVTAALNIVIQSFSCVEK